MSTEREIFERIVEAYQRLTADTFSLPPYVLGVDPARSQENDMPHIELFNPANGEQYLRYLKKHSGVKPKTSIELPSLEPEPVPEMPEDDAIIVLREARQHRIEQRERIERKINHEKDTISDYEKSIISAKARLAKLEAHHLHVDDAVSKLSEAIRSFDADVEDPVGQASAAGVGA